MADTVEPKPYRLLQRVSGIHRVVGHGLFNSQVAGVNFPTVSTCRDRGGVIIRHKQAGSQASGHYTSNVAKSAPDEAGAGAVCQPTTSLLTYQRAVCLRSSGAAAGHDRTTTTHQESRSGGSLS